MCAPDLSHALEESNMRREKADPSPQLRGTRDDIISLRPLPAGSFRGARCKALHWLNPDARRGICFTSCSARPVGCPNLVFTCRHRLTRAHGTFLHAAPREPSLLIAKAFRRVRRRNEIPPQITETAQRASTKTFPQQNSAICSEAGSITRQARTGS